jgi:hypothetical protein
MLRCCAVVAIVGLLLGGLVYAEKEFATRAFVVSCDAKTKTITIRHTDDNGKWTQSVATWDDKTEWERADTEATQYSPKPATAALAGELKKDSKVYITISDRGGPKLWVLKVRLLPPSAEVK